MAEPQKLKVVENPSVTECYANKLVAASFDGSAVMITLGATRLVPFESSDGSSKVDPSSVHVTARVVLSPTGAVELSNALSAMLKTISQRKQQAAGTKGSENG